MEKEEIINSIWINTEKIINNNIKKEKPCKKCGYCPYGCIVEEFPFSGGEFSCNIFGHDCPMYYNAEDISEFGREKLKGDDNVKGKK